MPGLSDLSQGVSSEQQALLKGRNFSLRPLSTAGHLDTCKVLSLTWQPILLFIFVLEVLSSQWPFSSSWRYSSETTVQLIAYIGIALQLLLPTLALGVVLLGVAVAWAQTRVKPSAVVYWTWWPFWRLVLCVCAALFGGLIADHLWYNQFYPHERLERLQAYTQIDPLTVGGVRVQDAGVIVFNSTAGVDRMRSGCLKNSETYCVAPIVFGGQVPNQTQENVQTDVFNGAPGSHTQVYDMFMAGTNCCSCPGEFRCGDWNQPLQTVNGVRGVGGIRVLQPSRRDFFRLAAQDWAATHGKVSPQPIFFEWVADPVAYYNELQTRGLYLWGLSLLVVPLGLVLSAVVLNGILQMLCRAGLAAPIEAPASTSFGQGIGRMMAQMYQQRSDEEAQPASTKYVLF